MEATRHSTAASCESTQPPRTGSVSGCGVDRRIRLVFLLAGAVASAVPLASAQIQQTKLLATGLTNSSGFGENVVLMPGWAICSASSDTTVQSYSGAVYSGSRWLRMATGWS